MIEFGCILKTSPGPLVRARVQYGNGMCSGVLLSAVAGQMLHTAAVHPGAAKVDESISAERGVGDMCEHRSDP